MVTPTFDISEYGPRRTRARAARAPREVGECLQYRLDVLAGSAVDVVQSAGGWLYDRVMAGWKVAVLLPRGCAGRPLHVLGVRVLDLESGFEEAGGVSQSLAASAEAFTGDARIREKVLEAVDNRVTEVALWGDGWPLEMDRGMTRMQHVLSAAARVFKRQALAAAGIPCASVDPTETLLSDVAACPPVDSQLIRLG
ncbi:hypothetical protein [Mycobacterium lacus]|uniref:Uncharacterized protein n=1 Tax=Mycobacterium lacus TaxID=169765 RepID=A0A1X1XNC0_9MYCO|nr:hypothetical protein [Mycobacterium lacus]MCV7122038.1 hypothetical protein [Mycobacterium lacus]ORW00244.1 hypothetical protein AWC15_08935 [Mycobacterium lacus]BBX98757.1 hypothetical protein MLAC_40510 [Mycobacterium lacus]